MSTYVEFAKDIEKYLKSRFPDMAEHDVLEVSAYVVHRAAIFTADEMREPIRQMNKSYRFSYRSYYGPSDDQIRLYPSTREVEDILFPTREKAEEALTKLKDVISDFGQALMSDFYDIAGIDNYNYLYNKYGWTKLDDVGIMRCRNGYCLNLPKALLMV